MENNIVYIITAIYEKTFRPSNIFFSEKEAVNCIKDNFFDIWEGYTNDYMVIEKMPIGCPWMVEEIAWFGREKLENSVEIDNDGNQYINRKAIVFEIDKPKEFKSICNFGIG